MSIARRSVPSVDRPGGRCIDPATKDVARVHFAPIPLAPALVAKKPIASALIATKPIAPALVATILIATILISTGLLAAGAGAQELDPTTVARADSLYGAGAWGEATAAYASLTQAAPGDARLWYRYGVSLLQTGDARGAVGALEKAEAIGHDPTVMYNLACALTRANEPDRALDWLAKAAEAGFNQTHQLDVDTDLTPLHRYARWSAVRTAVDRNARPCAHDDRYRFLEFWIGDWNVFTAEGSPAGESHVEQILGSCVIFENWTGFRGMSGKSFNFIDPASGDWKQTWVDDKGDVHEYVGKIVERAMHFSREYRGDDGRMLRHRMSLTPLEPGHVRQLGERSEDGGTTWTVLYDLHYSRKMTGSR